VTPLKQHLDWFATALSNDARLLLMVGQHGKTLGHVRLDRDPDYPDLAEISIYLNPACRGAGLARPVLEAAMRFARGQGIHCFRAQAHRDNAASIRLFTKAGFITSCEDGAFLELCMPETNERDAV
jgi:L-amino acid N-acyltransferase YncA